jgi:hypothetical protein
VRQFLVADDVLDRVAQLVQGIRAQDALLVGRRQQNDANRQCDDIGKRVLKVVHADNLVARTAGCLLDIAADSATLRRSCRSLYFWHVLACVPAGRRPVRFHRPRHTSLVTARLMASMGADVIDSHFVEGHELLPEMAGRVPTSSVGRLLSADEALELVAAMVKRRA